MGTGKTSIFREALQVSPERVAALDDASLNEMMRALLSAQAYRCGTDVAQVLVNTEGRATDDGCDGWSPKPPSDDSWLGGADTCWQFKAGAAGERAKLRGEVTKRIPAETLRIGGRFVVVASASVSGKKGEDDRLKVLREVATAAGLPTDKIEVLTSERLTTWCNQHPAIAARWAGRPDGLWFLADWERSEEHQVPWQSTKRQKDDIQRLHGELDLMGEGVVHVHIQGRPGVGKSRFALELCKLAPWRQFVLYVRQASDLRLNEVLDSAAADQGVRVVVIADEVQPEQLRPLNDSVRRGEGRVRLVTIGHCSTPDPAQIPAFQIVPLDRELMAAIIQGWHPAMPMEHIDFLARFADGYVRLARLAADAVARNPALDVRTLLEMDHIRGFLDGMLGSGDRRCLYVVAALESVGWADDRQGEARSIAEHLGLSWTDVRVGVEDFHRRLGIAPRGGRLRYISPAPLGVYLALEAWNVFPDELKSLPSKLPSEEAREAYHDRLRAIASNPQAKQFAQEELTHFFRVDDFQDSRSVRRWAALASADPARAARQVRECLARASRHERLAISDKARRELVWGLVRLAWGTSAFRDAVLALAYLAEAENERWANNATAEFSGKFLIGLGGTTVPYLARLEVLDEICSWGDAAYTRLAINALVQVGNRHETRMGSEPVSGTLPEPERATSK